MLRKCILQIHIPTNSLATSLWTVRNHIFKVTAELWQKLKRKFWIFIKLNPILKLIGNAIDIIVFSTEKISIWIHIFYNTNMLCSYAVSEAKNIYCWIGTNSQQNRKKNVTFKQNICNNVLFEMLENRRTKNRCRRNMMEEKRLVSIPKEIVSLYRNRRARRKKME